MNEKIPSGKKTAERAEPIRCALSQDFWKDTAEEVISVKCYDYPAIVISSIRN